MISNKKIGIIGGDYRQYYLSQALAKDGNDVYVTGLEKIENSKKFDTKNNSVKEVIDLSEYIILPVPITRDHKTLNAPFSEHSIYLDNNLFNELENKKVFGGIISSIESKFKNKDILYDYYCEEFMILNSIPTSEGAIKIAMEQNQKTICDSKCLVVGYGRIGKILSKMLKNMGATVTISTRKKEDLSWTQTRDYNITNILKTEGNLNFDTIFNTVPAKIFNYDILSRCPQNTLIIDLSSAPGAIDNDVAEKLNINTIHALGIPGNFFPKTAGEIVKKIIYKIIEEENL